MKIIAIDVCEQWYVFKEIATFQEHLENIMKTIGLDVVIQSFWKKKLVPSINLEDFPLTNSVTFYMFRKTKIFEV